MEEVFGANESFYFKPPHVTLLGKFDVEVLKDPDDVTFLL